MILTRRGAFDDLVERGYLGLFRLVGHIAEMADWNQLGAAISHTLGDFLEESGGAVPTRMWASAPGGLRGVGPLSTGAHLSAIHSRDLQRAARLGELPQTAKAASSCGLLVGGVTVGVL